MNSAKGYDPHAFATSDLGGRGEGHHEGRFIRHVQINAERSPWHEENNATDHRPPTTDHRPQTTDHRPDAASQIDWAIVPERLGLSGREIDIARLICQGRKAAAMARPLKISINTVKTHLRRLFKKCRVHDRASFVALVFCASQAKRG